MGSWNGTCAVSQVSITSGTKVKAVIIKNNVQMPEASGYCYNGGYASPFSFVIDGIYNDYGAMDSIEENKASELFKQYFVESLSIGNLRVNADKYSDYEMFPDGNIDYSKASTEDLIKVIERDRVFVNDSYYNYKTERMEKAWVNIGIMMVHKDIFELVRDSLYNSLDWDYKDFTKEGLEEDCLYMIEDQFESTRLDSLSTSEIKELELDLEKWKDNPNKVKQINKDIAMVIKVASLSRNNWITNRKSGRRSNQVRILRGSEGTDMKVYDRYHSYLRDNYKAEDKEDIQVMLVDMVVLINIMTALRKSWASQAGKGSQSFLEEVYFGLARGIRKAIYTQRGDLEGQIIYCYTKDFKNFEHDGEYKINSIDYNLDAISIELDNETIETITYKELEENFEY